MQIVSYWKIIVEILLLWYVIYMALYLIRGTRTEQLLKGLLILGVIFIITQQLKLDAITWLLQRVFPISVVALLVIFQPELRRGLSSLGQFGMYQEESEVIEEIAHAAITLSKKRHGALIAIEREVGLKNYIETGVAIESRVSQEILASIFMPQGPIHDGACIVRGDKLVAAGCSLPLAQDTSMVKSHGMRHRAAIGLTEETDAVCVVVSGENGCVSVAIGGRLHRDLDAEALTKALHNAFTKPRSKARRSHIKLLAFLSPKVREKDPHR